MGRVKAHTYGQPKGILKYFDYLGEAVVVSESMGVDDGNGNKIVKAGTPFPTNDAECKGYVLENVDVTYGDAPATIIYSGSIDEKKVIANGITVNTTAKSATPRVTFFA